MRFDLGHIFFFVAFEAEFAALFEQQALLI